MVRVSSPEVRILLRGVGRRLWTGRQALRLMVRAGSDPKGQRGQREGWLRDLVWRQHSGVLLPWPGGCLTVLSAVPQGG